MKVLRIIFLILISSQIFGQISTSSPTSSFTVKGKVKKEKSITLEDLKKYPNQILNNVNTSCSPKNEERSNNVKVVLLKSVLDSVEYDYQKSRNLNQFYFLFVAEDGYKIVFSFNEIYNTEIGNNLFIVTEKDGNMMEDMNNRILLLSTKDLKGGSRNMKWLSKIIVCKAE
jgi:hypothetical protein